MSFRYCQLSNHPAKQSYLSPENGINSCTQRYACGYILGYILVARSGAFLALVGFYIDDIVGLEVVNLGVEEGLFGEVYLYGGGNAIAISHDGDVVLQSIHRDIATLGQRFQNGEAVALYMDFLRGPHLPYHGNSEVHRRDGDDGIQNVPFVDQPILDEMRQGVLRQASRTDPTQEGELNQARLGDEVAIDVSYGEVSRLLRGFLRLQQRTMSGVQSKGSVGFGHKDTGLLVEGYGGIGGLAIDIDVELVAGMDGGIVGGDDGTSTVNGGIGEIGQLLVAPAGEQEANKEGEGEELFHG